MAAGLFGNHVNLNNDGNICQQRSLTDKADETDHGSRSDLAFKESNR